MKDLARRYYVMTGTAGGRRRLSTGVLMVAVSLNLIASFLPMTIAYRRAALTLYAIGGGMLLAAVVVLFLNRKAS